MDFGGGDEIRFERQGAAAIVTLNRPQSMNALTHGMIRALSAALTEWATDRSVALVILRGEGKAFCAGGDLHAIYREGKAGRPPLAFFADEYRLNGQIARFPKPYVSLINGLVLGGGVGISCHGSHRVMTENAALAMPEVGIGFFPDVGATHLLPDLGGSFGFYLGLTGTRIGYGDALWSGLATHTVKAEYVAGLIERSGETGDVDLALREAFGQARRETDRETLAKIARHFCKPTLEAIWTGLQAEAATDAFADATLAVLRSRSPTSLHVAFRAMKAGLTMSMDDCLRMEYRILTRMLAGHDLYEGIRAAVIDKGSPPHWQPETLGQVTPDMVDAHFAPLPGGDLQL